MHGWGGGGREWSPHAEVLAGRFRGVVPDLDAPPGLSTAHVRTVLGTPDQVVAQAYAGMHTDPGAVGIRPHSEAYLRPRTQPALTVWTSEGGDVGTRHPARTGIPRGVVEYWPDSGHYLHEGQHPERTTRLVADWDEDAVDQVTAPPTP
ncbi:MULTISPECIES: hypothetical protein [unclassified Streptomyces]|uniref:alpha/beta fold hydrolase n=1 Tax=unclassified Streptomyces TaxID=2593676 RepID=UPI0023662C07|nr:MULTISPECIES: hypothetical protein [unclassified Streptomyces]MDF3143050.1 hypothetical protein [Streptomyces sp. T21Q-yed]WDF44440.1 hypothetical protein PBV52_50510 [Streptomyces sp. T12]